MIKVKDGYAKLIGTTYSGSADRVLLSNGGDKAVSDFAAASGVVTALGTNGNYVTWTKNGIANNLTVPYSSISGGLTGVYSTSSLPSNTLDAGWIKYYYNINLGTEGLFNHHNNANGILSISKHQGNYLSQLGFSSDGRLYFRSANGVDINSLAWKTIAYTSEIPTKVSQLTNDAGYLTNLPSHDHGYIISNSTSKVKGLTYYTASGISETLADGNSWCKPAGVGSDGNSMILRMRWSSGVYGHDIFASPNTSTLWHRNIQNDTYVWRELLDSGNYNSYTPKLDGTGASGTWGINISGSADKLDGYHAGFSNNQVSVYVPFPSWSTLKSTGFINANYGNSDYGHPDEEFLKGICKWAIYTYPNQGDITLMGIIAPNSSGTCILHLYSSSGKDSTTLLPKYCRGQYLTLDGGLYHFGTYNYVWSYSRFARASELKNPTNYYWANINITSSPDSTKIPTLGGLIANGNIKFTSTGIIGTSYSPSDTTMYNNITINSSTGGIQYKSGSWTSGDHVAHNFLTGTSNSSILTIMNSGNVGIGTTTPVYKLDVRGSIKSYSHVIDTEIKDHSKPTEQCLVINSTTTPSGVSLTLKNSPGIGFHIASLYWASLVYGYNARFNFINSSADGYAPVAASSFIKADSTNDYVLLGGGGHKLESSLSVGNADTVDNMHASQFVPKNYNNIAYSDLTAYYTGSASPGYYRIILPDSVLSIWNMLTIELTVNQNYSNGYAGKILIYCHNNGSNTFPVFKATCLGTLTSDIKIYGSGGKYIYIGGCSSWGTVSIDKILVGDSATGKDQSSIYIDTTASLPTTYQTASMSYNIDSSNIGSQSVNYATSAGTASNSNKLGGYAASDYVLKTDAKIYRWSSTIKGQTWSRLYTGSVDSVLHHSSMFSISGSIGCVVFSQTFLVVGNHSTNAKIIQLNGGSYTQCQMRALVKSNGTVLIDMYWVGNDCDNSTSTNTMTIKVNAFCFAGDITPTTSFTSDATIPSGYSDASTISTRSNCMVLHEVYAYGNMYAAHFYENSDANLKKNIKVILDSDNIPVIKEFDWKSDGTHSYGLIAQELEEQGYSELVSDSGSHKTVNYSAALSLIVGKLQNKIKELEKEIENLKLRN